MAHATRAPSQPVDACSSVQPHNQRVRAARAGPAQPFEVPACSVVPRHGGRRDRRRSALSFEQSTLTQHSYLGKERWDEENPDGGREQHSEEHAGTDRVPALRTGAARDQQRYDAENEGEGGHENRAQSLARRLDGGLANREPLRTKLVREFHDQDRVLRSQSDDDNQPDLEVEDRKSTRLNSSHDQISYAVFC